MVSRRAAMLATMLALTLSSGAQELEMLAPHDPMPVLLWHGMGDTCCAGLLAVKERIEGVTGAYVHSISEPQHESAHSCRVGPNAPVPRR